MKRAKRQKIIEECAVPKYVQAGYIYVSDFPMAYSFFNENRTIEVEYTFSRDAQQLKMVFNLDYGEKSLRIIQADELIGIENTIFDMQCCRNEDELRSAATQFADYSLNTVLPILEKVSCWVVPFQSDLYTLLSQNTEDQARRFAQAHQLDMGDSSDPEEQKRWAERWFMDQLPQDPLQRRDIFLSRQQEFIEFIAYLGEIIKKRVPRSCKWQWFNGIDSGPNKEYVILYDKEYNESLGADPLYSFIDRWNFQGVLKDVRDLL